MHMRLHLKGMRRVLIVEDEQPLREAFALLLKSEGYEVALAENGQVALKKLKSFKPHLVLLDMLMPVMSGLDFLKRAQRVRPQPDYTQPKTLVLSNLTEPITEEDMERFAVSRSVLKANLSPSELAATVRELLEA